jgi:uncharacterized protein (TIGR02996 family)
VSEEDAFLDGIAADRADRSRLLVFADWLADRSDPREEFVRLHARLLDLDGTEPGFADLESKWVEWINGVRHTPGYLPGPVCPPRLPERWIDAICRLFTAADLAYCPVEPDLPGAPAERWVFEQMDHKEASREEYLLLYRGAAADFAGPFDFAVRTVLSDLWDDPSRAGASYPVTRGSFWQQWRSSCAALRNPPALPNVGPENLFLGAQYIQGDWNNWAFVAAHRDEYFALFWSTTA